MHNRYSNLHCMCWDWYCSLPQSLFNHNHTKFCNDNYVLATDVSWTCNY